MATMKSYPSREMAALALTDAQLLQRLDDLSDYSKQTDVVNFNGESTVTNVRAFLDFYEILVEANPELNLQLNIHAMKIWRKLSTQELQDKVLSDVQQDMYYHPENYAIVTHNEIKES